MIVVNAQESVERTVLRAENAICLKTLLKKWPALIVIAIAVAAIVVMVFRSWDRTAIVYNGKSLKEWAVALRAPDANERAQATAAIQIMGPQAVPGLVRLLKTKDTGLRRFVWGAAKRLPRKARAWFFQEFPWPDPNEASIVGARGLGILGPQAESAVSALGQALQGRDRAVGIEAATALAHVGKASVPILIEALKDKNVEVRHAAVYALGEIGAEAESAVPLLIPFLGETNEPLRNSTVYTLSRIGPSEISTLISLLNNGDARTREAAEKVLLQSFSSMHRAMPVLERLSKDDSPAVREQTLDLLTSLRQADLFAVHLATRALQDTNAQVRLKAITALAQVPEPSQLLVGPLIASLKDDSPAVRAGAARALAGMGHTPTRAVPGLEKLLQDPDEHVRTAAMEALRVLQPGISNTVSGLEISRP